jgi:hypothetical protein
MKDPSTDHMQTFHHMNFKCCLYFMLGKGCASTGLHYFLSLLHLQAATLEVVPVKLGEALSNRPSSQYNKMQPNSVNVFIEF